MIEGERVVAEALGLGVVEELFITVDRAELARRAERCGIRPAWVSERVVATLSDTVASQGAVAVVRSPLVTLDEVRSTGLVVVLDGISDPGNAGVLLRTSAAAGAAGVVLTRGSVDPTNPKAVRSSAGAILRIPVVAGCGFAEVVGWAEERGLRTVGTAADAPTSMYQADLTGSVAVVLGNESHGLPGTHRSSLDELVSIPMPGPAESLNVSVAGSILLFEAVRQRLTAAEDGYVYPRPSHG